MFGSGLQKEGGLRLGHKLRVGRVGDDAAGAFVRERLVERGVDVSALTVDPSLPTPLTTIVTRGADRAILTAPGCLLATGPQDVPPALVADCRHVHAASLFLMPHLAGALAGLFRTAREHGATTSLDTNDDPSGRWDPLLLRALLEVTDVLLPNAAEARAIAGSLRGVTGQDAPADLAEVSRELTRRGPLVVIKDGADGALADDGTGPIRTPADRIEPVDTVGAGDSFDAGFIAAMLRGLGLPRALAFATACGSLSTRAAGGTTAQADWAEAALAADTTGRKTA